MLTSILSPITSGPQVSVHVGAKRPGFSYRKTSLATQKHLPAILLRLWSTKNPVSDYSLNGYARRRLPRIEKHTIDCSPSSVSSSEMPFIVDFFIRGSLFVGPESSCPEVLR